MSDERFKETMIECVDLIFHFLKERIDECPQFIYIIDLAMNRVFLDLCMQTNLMLTNETRKVVYDFCFKMF